MAKGIKILEEHIPDGLTAQKGSSISYSARFFLHRGDEVTHDYRSIEMYGGAVPTIVVEGVKLIEHKTILGKRRTIAGVEKALIGMSPGSYRDVMIPPHLAYGIKGLGEMIPANALLRSKLWVHDVQAGTEQPALVDPES